MGIDKLWPKGSSYGHSYTANMKIICCLIIATAATAFAQTTNLPGPNVVAWGSPGGPVPAHLTDAVAIAAGMHGSLAIRENGSVVAWGNEDYLNVPADLTNAIAVSAHEVHCLALRADGTVVAWGRPNSGQWYVPTGLNHVVAIATSYDTSSALKDDGTVVSWNNGTVWNRPCSTNIIKISRNANIQIGNTFCGTAVSNVIAIDSGTIHSIVLKDDRTVASYGGGWGESLVPDHLTNIVAVAAGWWHNLTINDKGTITAWGNNNGGQCNVPTNMAFAKAIAGGAWHSLAIIDPSRSGSPPKILAQPANRVAAIGSTVLFTVRCNGGQPISYQWFRNGTNILARATNSIFAIAGLQPSDAGDYSVLLSNSVGTVMSQPATLKVLPS